MKPNGVPALGLKLDGLNKPADPQPTVPPIPSGMPGVAADGSQSEGDSDSDSDSEYESRPLMRFKLDLRMGDDGSATDDDDDDDDDESESGSDVSSDGDESKHKSLPPPHPPHRPVFKLTGLPVRETERAAAAAAMPAAPVPIGGTAGRPKIPPLLPPMSLNSELDSASDMPAPQTERQTIIRSHPHNLGGNLTLDTWIYSIGEP